MNINSEPSAFEHLPYEIFFGICQCLPPRRDLLLPAIDDAHQFSSLWSLSMCNKRLSYLVTPLLYAAFGEIGSVRKLPMFLRTVLERPDLARHVRSFSGCSFQQDYQVPSKYRKPEWRPRMVHTSIWSFHDIIAIQNAIRIVTNRHNLAYYSFPARPDETFVRRWSRRMFNPSHCTWDAIVALILCHLPNLETFRIDSYSDDRQHAHDGIQGFEFMLRVLRSSRINGQEILLQKLQNVHLKFVNSLHRKRLQRTLLHGLPPLKTFRYEVFRNMDQHRSSSRRSREVGLSLRHLRQKLLADSEHSVEELSIVIRYVSAHARLSPLGSLSIFKNLKHIRASAHVLIGTPTLPNSWHLKTRSEVAQEAFYSPAQEEDFYRCLPIPIEVLVLVDCPNAMYGCMKRFLQSDQVPPKLKWIELAYTYPDLSQRDCMLDAIFEWMSGENSEWCLKFPGETWATKKELQDLALRKEIVLFQKIDENYME